MSYPVLGSIGLWSMEMRFGDKQEVAAAAAEIDELGYGTLWIPGGIDDAVLEDVSALLAATQRMAIATGILNIWKYTPQEVADWFHALPDQDQQRVLIGVGVSHGPIIGEVWKKPLAATRGFIEGLLAAGMPTQQLCVAALGPRMLELSRDLTAGAHPYLVTPEHTKIARDILGVEKILAPEQGVILETDPDKARALARQALSIYASLPNYRNSWLRLGLTQDDIDTVSDRLVDALFAWGNEQDIIDRVQAHQEAGADHVCLQVIQESIGQDVTGFLAACRTLAKALAL